MAHPCCPPIISCPFFSILLTANAKPLPLASLREAALDQSALHFQLMRGGALLWNNFRERARQ